MLRVVTVAGQPLCSEGATRVLSANSRCQPWVLPQPARLCVRFQLHSLPDADAANAIYESRNLHC